MARTVTAKATTKVQDNLIEENRDDICPVQRAIDIIGGRWKAIILFHLSEGTLRFGELHRLVPGVTQQMLTQQLRQLEADDIVHREVYRQVPPRVEYSLTERGRTLNPILTALCEWGAGEALEGHRWNCPRGQAIKRRRAKGELEAAD